MLVFNDTKVIRARLQFFKTTGAKIEIFCLEPYDPVDYESSFAKRGNVIWKCLVGNLKKWRNEILEKKIEIKNNTIIIQARKLDDYNNWQIIQFNWTDENLSFAELLEETGETPIPPYLERGSEPLDHGRYQTIYAKAAGSVAAPTAGLHFTSDVFREIEIKGISKLELTLHVGAGTFRPVLTDLIRDHIMHSEHFYITMEEIERLLQFKGQIIAVGTTSVRTLESLYWCGLNLLLSQEFGTQGIHISQWDWTKSDTKYNTSDMLYAVLDYMHKTRILFFNARTQLMILPGYTFKSVDGMITNFHQPRSTLLMLVAALIGKDWEKVYDRALKNNYRFLSYGDSSLLINPRRVIKP